MFSALGSRAERLPGALSQRLSLEGTGAKPGAGATAPGNREDARGETSPVPPATQVERKLSGEDYDVVARCLARRAGALLDPVPGMAERERLRLAMVIPPFSRGSGGHNTLFQIFSRLERRGHACSVWLADYNGYARDVWPAVLRADINEFFAPFKGPVYKGFDDWQGADVAIATGWQTVHAMLAARALPRARLRRQRPRARVLPVLDRARARRRHLPLRPALHRREPMAARSADRALRRERRRLPARRR